MANLISLGNQEKAGVALFGMSLLADRDIARRACGFALFCGLLCMCDELALAQDKVPSKPEDEIYARKVLMGAIDRNTDAIDWMVTSNKPFSLAEAIERADTISAMLMNFPHLFPPETNRWRPNTKRNPARDTFASPVLWTNFADFYRRAQEASRAALDITRAKEKADLKSRFQALRAACDSYHAAYMKTDK
jgi:cytochrome c556